MVSSNESTQRAHIVVPAGVKVIKYREFEGRKELETIELPDSITEICDSAFDGCTSLKKIIIPSSVRKIGRGAFHGCSSLIKVTLPDSVTDIANAAFSRCTSLRKINIPTSVRRIGSGAFFNCSSLTQVILPNSITYISKVAFAGCTSLVYVYLPTSLRSLMDNEAFDNCTNLLVFVLPRRVTWSKTFEYPSFRYCTTLETIPRRWELWSSLEHRFDELPLHRVCYDPNITMDTLTATIEAISEKNGKLDSVDDYSMNALHILCSNPSVKASMILKLINACPSLLSMKNIKEETPLMMFLQCKGIDLQDEEGSLVKERVSLHHCLQNEIESEGIECLFVMDKEMQSELNIKDEESGLYPFMEIAINPAYDFKALYGAISGYPGLLLLDK